MAYLQLAARRPGHRPAAISVEEWSHWYTPAHMIGGWEWWLQRRVAEDNAHEIIAAPAPAERADAALDEASGKPVQLALF